MNRFSLLVPLLLAVLSVPGLTQTTASTKVLVLEIRAEIDPRMTRYVTLALEQARASQADYVVVDMDTYGGAVNDADAIRKMLLEFPRPVFVFINKNAASAGALISLACDSIYMASGASMGAVTVVTGQGEAAPDKYQSYMRSMMRATAEAQGRNPAIAEGMVDPRVKLDSTIKKAGQVITFTPSEAIRYDFCDGLAVSVEEVLAKNNVRNYTVERYQLPGSERVIAFFLNPVISSILILLIFGGIWYELQAPGIGFALLTAIVAGVLYLVPYYLNGLAANWELLVLVIGIGLLLVEVLVLPGFGVAGITGLILTTGALVLVMLNNDFFDFSNVSSNALLFAILAALVGMSGGMALVIFGGAQLLKNDHAGRVTLQHTLDSERGYTATSIRERMIGKTGSAHTVLRPGGKVQIEGEIYDANTTGEYIERGGPVIVVAQENTNLQVRRVV